MGGISTAGLAILEPISRLLPNKSGAPEHSSSSKPASPMANLTNMPLLFSSPTFLRFSEFPLEIRLKIYHFAIDSSSPQIIPAKLRSGNASLFPRPPRFPPSVLALMHTSREARVEILSTFQLLRFPVHLPLRVVTYRHCPLSPDKADCWPAPRGNEHLSSLERRWQSRGSHLVNVRSDLVFFGRWPTRDLMRVYGKDFVAAMIFTLSEVRYLAISMQGWKEAGPGWLKVLKDLEKAKEVVFVRELDAVEMQRVRYAGPGLSLVELSEMDGAAYESSGELWRERILGDLEREKGDSPSWKFPKIEFKGIVEGLPLPVYGNMPRGEMCEGTAPRQRTRKLRPGSSWRRR